MVILKMIIHICFWNKNYASLIKLVSLCNFLEQIYEMTFFENLVDFVRKCGPRTFGEGRSLVTISYGIDLFKFCVFIGQLEHLVSPRN